MPTKVAPVSHAQAMDSLTQRFAKSVGRQLEEEKLKEGDARRLAEIGGISGLISGVISGGVTVTTTTANADSNTLSGARQPKLVLTLLAIAAALAV